MPNIANLTNSNLNSLQMMTKINEGITDLNGLTNNITSTGAIKTNNNNINAGTGGISCGEISCKGAITTNNNDIIAGIGKISCRNITSSGYIICNNSQNTGSVLTKPSSTLSTGIPGAGAVETYLGFGGGGWHEADYANIKTITAETAGDVNTFVFLFTSGNSWIKMYRGGTLASNTSFTIGSDNRIKNIINKIEDDECINIIRNINMYKYKLKDINQQKRYSNNYSYGFIAQNILQALPQAVNHTTNAIPSIQKNCSIIDDILELDNIEDIVDEFDNIYKYEYEPKINDTLELIDLNKNQSIKLQIKEIITNKKFRIIKNDKIDYNAKYLVYGNVINDYLSLEYNTIHSVGIGAIKNLDKEIQNIKNENRLLKEKLNIIMNHLNL